MGLGDEILIGSRWVRKKNKRVAEVTGTTKGWVEYRYLVPETPTSQRVNTCQARHSAFREDFAPEKP